MSTISIRLYDIFRKNLKLQEAEAKELVEVIQNVVEEKQADKHKHLEQMVQKDIKLLNEHMDLEFGHMKAYIAKEFAHLDFKFATKEDLSSTRVEIVRWMFIFWVGQIAATFGFILLFLKK
ncbi:hypothetical protein HB364_28910 [Pseudoflavitalea sp. X16]|uniref:hypothetical protein n=1 Tax=Paraflavitalea devenefica TaxID=2716334 RepID=UPI00141E83F3|nr:hypothetical protein [Paraflavitalea devenefica]NII29134.1 hypothetical protein [Paraflavitalea devenefica]